MIRPTYPKSPFSRVLWVGVIILALVGVGMAVRRELYLTNLISPVTNRKFGSFDAAINDHTFLTWLHIIPGTLYLLLAPFQFVTRLRTRYPGLHHWVGRICITAGTIIGVTALFMSVITPIGGINETLCTLLFACLFLFALLKGLWHVLRREITQHREWMLRAFAIGLAIATVRPIVAMFFVFSSLSPHEFFGTAFWLGFTLHLIIAEIWINYSRGQRSEIRDQRSEKIQERLELEGRQ